MATFHRERDGVRVAVKGAPEAILPACGHVLGPGGVRALDEEGRAAWLDRSDAMAGSGLRVLALAEKRVESADAPPYDGLALLAMVGMHDPARHEAREALAACRRAGMRVVMATGDQAGTARSIAAAVGLIADPDAVEVVHGADLPPPAALDEAQRRLLRAAPIFARVAPEQKLRLIELHQDAGEIVAMTGDGVNDAPALRKADIGVAMGRRGTQAAREASAMVLQDDSFATIVRAVAQGRVIFTNIRRFVVYLLSCNLSEILIVFAASAAGAPLPVLPLQILYLNLVTDVFPALALGFGEGDPGVLHEPPRKRDEPIIARRHWFAIGASGLVLGGAVLGALAIALLGLDLGEARAVTVSFLTLALAQVWHAFSMRSPGSHPLRNDVVGSPWVWSAVALCVTLLIAAVYLPWLSGALGTRDPGAAGWGVAFGMSLLPQIAGQAWAQWGVRARVSHRPESRGAGRAESL
jgi:Ca2+-transporting ATPase